MLITGPLIRHAAGIDLDEAPTTNQRQFTARFHHDFHAAAQVNLLAGFNELPSANLDVLVDAHGQVVVGAGFDFAVGVDGVVFFGFEFAVAVLLDGVVALVANANLLVVLDVFVPVTLGVQEDLFLAFFVLDAQFVETAATRGAQGFEGAAGFVRRQGVGDDVFLVVQAAADQRLIGVAFEEA